MRANWRPVLHGDEAAEALAVARDVAAAIEPLIDTCDDASVAGGASGHAVLATYLDRALPENGYDRMADRWLARAATLLRRQRMDSGMFSGFPGVVWTISHLDAMRNPDARDRGAAIDDALGVFLERSPWTGCHDLVSGLAGLGVYAAERAARPTAARCASSIVARLDETAERRDGGITWHTPPRLLPPNQRELVAEGYYNLGVAHGIPGIIAALATLWAAGVDRECTRFLLDGAVAWLLSMPWADGNAAAFPAWVPVVDGAPRHDVPPARLAWCYGDLGVAAALLVAARAVGEGAWEHAALCIARRAAARPQNESGVADAALCHGAAGVGHVFNRLYQATGDESLGAAARMWIRRALDMREPRCGVAGYRAYAGADDSWKDDAGFLTGAGGIALALAAAATEIEPAWDRVLLLSSQA